MTSVAQTVPADIVHDIFAYFSTSLEPVFPDHFPWYLGHICSGWRVIFLSMIPQFWSKIGFYIHNPCLNFDPQKIGRITNLVQYFFERNDGHPFDLDFVWLYRYADALEKMSHILDMLVTESPRWRDVDLSIDPSHIPTLCGVKGRLPLLRSLTLTKMSLISPQVLEDFNNTFACAPSLVRLNISAPNPGWKTNWSQLRFLRLESPHLDTMLAILEQARNIETLIVVPREFEYTNNAGIIILPNLKYLKVVENPTCMKHINAPALNELELDNVGNVDPWRSRIAGLTDHVVSFLCRSNCNITRLTLTRMNEPIHLDILRCMPELTHLTLGWLSSYVMRETIIVLTKPFSSSSLQNSQCAKYPAGRLQVLQLRDLDHYSFTFVFDLLSKLISVRSKGPGNEEERSSQRLRTVVIELPEEYIPPEVELFQNTCGEFGIQMRLALSRDWMGRNVLRTAS